MMAAYDADYLRILARSKFTLAPRGDQPWSIRFYEAILCGSIPLVKAGRARNRAERTLDYKYYDLGPDGQQGGPFVCAIRAPTETLRGLVAPTAWSGRVDPWRRSRRHRGATAPTPRDHRADAAERSRRRRGTIASTKPPRRTPRKAVAAATRRPSAGTPSPRSSAARYPTRATA